MAVQPWSHRREFGQQFVMDAQRRQQILDVPTAILLVHVPPPSAGTGELAADRLDTIRMGFSGTPRTPTTAWISRLQPISKTMLDSRNERASRVRAIQIIELGLEECAVEGEDLVVTLDPDRLDVHPPSFSAACRLTKPAS